MNKQEEFEEMLLTKPGSIKRIVKWYVLDKDEASILLKIADKLNLPDLSTYVNKHHFLCDVYSRIVESSYLIKQADKLLNGTTGGDK